MKANGAELPVACLDGSQPSTTTNRKLTADGTSTILRIRFSAGSGTGWSTNQRSGHDVALVHGRLGIGGASLVIVACAGGSREHGPNKTR